MYTQAEFEMKITKALSNTGRDNTGTSNKGSLNSGDKNLGGCNTGTLNIGDYNSGDYNNGDFNAGICNVGDFNTGDFNLGDYNSGDFNLCSCSSGAFCTEMPKIKLFDNDSDLTLDDWRESMTYKILARVKTASWIVTRNMTRQEKRQHPEHKITGGYLKEASYKDAFVELWHVLTEDERNIIKSTPNFDKEKFKLITGIEV